MSKSLKLYDYNKFTKEQIDKFNSSFKKVKNENKDSKFYQDDCWLWQLSDERFAVDKVKIISRKFSYCLHLKEVLDGNKKEDKNFVIISDCGNSSCVNPNHLIKITKHQFNIRTNTGRFVGIKKSLETVQRMKIAQNRPEMKEQKRKALLGKKRPPEVGAKIKAAFQRPEVKEKRRKAMMGRVVTEETREKIRKAHSTPEMIKKKRERMVGYRLTPEAIEKTRQANLGRKHSKEAIEKLRKINLGRKLTPEQREKAIATLRSKKAVENWKKAVVGKPLPEETRKKISQSNKGRKKTEQEIKNITEAQNRLEVVLKKSGENSAVAKLSNDKVRFLRANVRQYSDISKYAVKFNVDRSTIRNAVNGKTWKYIDYENCQQRGGRDLRTSTLPLSVIIINLT